MYSHRRGQGQVGLHDVQHMRRLCHDRLDRMSCFVTDHGCLRLWPDRRDIPVPACRSAGSGNDRGVSGAVNAYVAFLTGISLALNSVNSGKGRLKAGLTSFLRHAISIPSERPMGRFESVVGWDWTVLPGSVKGRWAWFLKTALRYSWWEETSGF
jgi:hypothetical protein